MTTPEEEETMEENQCAVAFVWIVGRRTRDGAGLVVHGVAEDWKGGVTMLEKVMERWFGEGACPNELHFSDDGGENWILQRFDGAGVEVERWTAEKFAVGYGL